MGRREEKEKDRAGRGGRGECKEKEGKEASCDFDKLCVKFTWPLFC